MKKSSKSILIGLIAVLVAMTIGTGMCFAANKGDTPKAELKIAPCSEEKPLDNDGLFKGYVEKQLSIRRGAKPQSSVGMNLTGVNKAIYDALKAQAALVASGERDSTAFVLSIEDLGLETNGWTAGELGVENIVKDGYITQESVTALEKMLDIDLGSVIAALLADCPYEMYWYDKTVGSSMRGMEIMARYDGEWRLMLYSAGTIYMAVAQGYAAGEYQVDTNNAQRVQHAVEKAGAIVEENKTGSDLEKLTAYRQAICRLVSYDYASAGSDSTPYGDPWQLVSVFDEDNTTNVVCEGYSKAFQYLCDLTKFHGEVRCISVSGIMYGGTGEGGHMWNILHLDDGANYLADVTNRDAGTVGADDQLFLVGCTSGDVDNGYTYTCKGGHNIRYRYYPETRQAYTDELIMSDHPYVEDADIHEYVKVEAVAATCTEDGNTEYWKCEHCGRVYSDAEHQHEIDEEETIIHAKGHAFGDLMRGVSPTCEATGFEPHYQCSVCGQYFDKDKNEKTKDELTIPALGHDYQVDPSTAASPTCEDAGKEADQKCSRCDSVITGETIPALGHQWGEWTVVKEATEEEAGLERRVCTRNDSHVDEKGIPKLGHTHVFEKTDAIDATCTKDGNIEYWICSTCGWIYSDENGEHEIDPEETIVKALGHDYHKDETTAIVPTCENAGKEADQKCSRCDSVITGETIPALGHQWGEWTVVKEATEDEEGLESRVCERDDSCLEERIIPKVVHVHELEKIDAKGATCTEDGNIAYWKCTRCGRFYIEVNGEHEIHPEDTIIEAKGHNYGELIREVSPTYTTTGFAPHYQCTECGKYFDKDKVEKTREELTIPKLKPAAPEEVKGEDGTYVGKGASASVAEKAIMNAARDEGPAGTVFEKLQLKSTKQTKTSLTLTWTKVSGARKYVIYGNKCGSKMKKLAEATGKSKVIQKVAGNALKKGTYYKVIIVAFDRNDRVVSTSKVIYVSTKGGKTGNYKSVTVKKSVLKKAKALKKGKTLSLKATAVKASKLKVKTHRKVAYESSNPKIATVSGKGIVKAKKKGTCYIYAYAQNGVFKKIKVVVK